MKEVNHDKQTPLHLVFLGLTQESQECVECTKFLIEAGAGVNAKDSYNNTPLHYAVSSDLCFDDKTKCCNILIEFGVDLSIRNNDGDTPFHLAARNFAK